LNLLCVLMSSWRKKLLKCLNIFERFTSFFEYFRIFSNIFKRFRTFSSAFFLPILPKPYNSTPQPQIYAIGTCAIGILPNRLSSLTCQPITSLLCKTNPILSAVGGLQMNVTSFITKYYENKWQRRIRKNKPNTNPIQTQFKANLLDAQMNISSVLTKDYDNEQRTMNNERLCKTNPKQSQFQKVHLILLCGALLRPGRVCLSA